MYISLRCYFFYLKITTDGYFLLTDLIANSDLLITKINKSNDRLLTVRLLITVTKIVNEQRITNYCKALAKSSSRVCGL